MRFLHPCYSIEYEISLSRKYPEKLNESRHYIITEKKGGGIMRILSAFIVYTYDSK